MDRFPINDSDKTPVIFKSALEFIGAVRAGISWERFCTYAVRFSDAFIDMLNDSEGARNFLSSKGITTEYVQSNVRAILARLHLNKENDHYLTLALPHTATDTQIHKRWKELMRIYHPDRNNEEDAAICAKRINEAYSILKDPTKKIAYDRRATKPVEPYFTEQRKAAVHRDRLRRPLFIFISPEVRKKVPRLIIASCGAVSCIILLIIFLRNRQEVYTYQASALPEHYRQDAGQAHRTPDIEKGNPEKKEGNNVVGFQPAEPQAQDTKTLTGALLEKSRKDKETGGASVKAFNLYGSHARSAGVTAPGTSPSQAAQKNSMANTTSGLMEKTLPEKIEGSALNSTVRFTSPDQNIKKDISPASLQKESPQVQIDVPGETAHALPPVPAPTADHPNLETEVFLFMSQYITAYEEGDITRFMDLFSKSAVENSRLHYADIMRYYKKNFENSRYTYTLKNVRLQKGAEGVIVSGRYSIRKMTDDNKGLKTDGMIRWTLAKENGGLKIVKIDYDPK